VIDGEGGWEGLETGVDGNLLLIIKAQTGEFKLVSGVASLDVGIIDRIESHLLVMAGAIVRIDPSHLLVRDLEVLPSSERELLLETWNATEADYPTDVCIHELFEAQFIKTPRATAVVCGERSVSYKELNQQANKLAHHLIGLGVKPDDRVAICVDRSVEMVIGLMAILKAGGAYVPLDPVYPSARLLQILDDAAPSILLSDAAGREALGSDALEGRTVLDLDTLKSGQKPAWAKAPPTNPDPKALGLTSRNLAYVIYTSGSTGVPRGVMVEHRSVVNFSHELSQSIYRDKGSKLRVGWNASFAFDMSIKGLSQLLFGHCLVVIPQQVRAANEAFIEFLKSNEIDAFDSTPSQLELIIAAGLLTNEDTRHRTILLGGEKVSDLMWAQLGGSDRVTVYNMYGPTECTVDASIGLIRSEDKKPHIGRPISNTRIYILDEHHQPVPLGAVGELYIGGVGVARGYLNRPELTAERFLKDPFSKAEGGRMYKTGDLARYLPDGNIQFLGRNDHQVKIRGFRIELGEIEARLLEHALVREAVVTAREDGAEKRLVAYVVPAEETPELAATLRAHLAAHLPEYMVPSAFVQMASMPLTPNGKLDRKALPAPDGDAYARRGYEAPQGEVEEILAALWQELLGIEQVGRHDHFFELGGHSLLAVLLMVKIHQRFGASVALRDLFLNPTPSALTMVMVNAGNSPKHNNLIPIRPSIPAAAGSIT
jgi:amino acid adenylation domain-containing protein